MNSNFLSIMTHTVGWINLLNKCKKLQKKNFPPQIVTHCCIASNNYNKSIKSKVLIKSKYNSKNELHCFSVFFLHYWLQCKRQSSVYWYQTKWNIRKCKKKTRMMVKKCKKVQNRDINRHRKPSRNRKFRKPKISDHY